MGFTSFDDFKIGIETNYFGKKISTNKFKTLLDDISEVECPSGNYDKTCVKKEIIRNSDLTEVNWEEIVRYKGKNCLAHFSLANANLQFSNLTGLNLVHTPLPESPKLLGAKVHDVSIDFQQLTKFYNAGVRDFRDIELSGDINQGVVLHDVLLSGSAFNYLKQQGYLHLDSVHVANLSSDTLAMLKALKKDKSEATDTIELLKNRQVKLKELISKFPKLDIQPFPTTPLLKPYLMETAIAEIISAGNDFSEKGMLKNFNDFTENLVQSENILKQITADGITISESKQLENFKEDLQANTYKIEKSYLFSPTKETIEAGISPLKTGQGLKVTRLDNAASKRVVYIYKGEKDYGYFDESYWVPPNIALDNLYDFLQSINFILVEEIKNNHLYYAEQYLCSDTASLSVTRLRTLDASSNDSTIRPLTRASQYLFLLKRQLNDNIRLDKFTLLEDNKVLEGTPAELQAVEEANDLFHACERESRSARLCFYRLGKILYGPEAELHQRLSSIPDNVLAPTLLTRKKKALSTLEMLEQKNLKNVLENWLSPEDFTQWKSLSKKEKEATFVMLGRVDSNIAFNTFLSKYSRYSRSSAAGLDLDRGVKMGTNQRVAMLAHIKEGLISKEIAAVGGAGIKVMNKAPKVIGTQLRIPISTFQVKELVSGSKKIFKLNKFSNFGNVGGWFMVITALGYSVYEGWENNQAYSDLPLGFLEQVENFLRGAGQHLFRINPHSQSVQQFLDDKEVIKIKTERAMDFLKNNPYVLTYSGCLGEVYRVKKGFQVEPNYCSVKLDKKRPPGTYIKSRKTPEVKKYKNLEVICPPKFRVEKEALGSGSVDKADYACDQGFTIRNATRTRLFENDRKKGWHFFDVKHASYGELIAPAEGNNFLDASGNQATSSYYQNNKLILTNSNGDHNVIKTENMNCFLGRKNLTDIVDCLRMPLMFVDTQGGAEKKDKGGLDEIIECPYGTLSPYTQVISQQPEAHQYKINLGQGAILINLVNEEAILNLFFEQLTMRELLGQTSISIDKVNNMDRLQITIRDTKIDISMPSPVYLSFFDKQRSQLVVQRKDGVSFLITELSNNLSNEEKLKKCHAYQLETEYPLTCSMVIVTEAEGEPDWLEEDILFIDDEGQGWKFIGWNGEALDMIPYLAEGIHTLTDRDFAETPSWVIPFDPKHTLIYDKGSHLELRSDTDRTEKNFSLNLKVNLDKLEGKQLIYTDTGTFDCDKRENCFPLKDLTKYRNLAITQTMETEAIRELFQYHTFTSSLDDDPQKIIVAHNQESDGFGDYEPLTKKDIRPAFVKLIGFKPVAGSKVHNLGEDLFFMMINAGSHSMFSIRFKTWQGHEIEGLEFDTFSISGFPAYAEKGPGQLQSYLDRAFLKEQINEEIKKLANPLDIVKTEVFIARQFLEENFFTNLPIPKKEIIYKGLDLKDENGLDGLLSSCLFEKVKNIQPELFQSNKMSWQKLLYWMAAKASINLNTPYVRILFPMLEPEYDNASRMAEIFGVINNNKPSGPIKCLHDKVSSIINGGSWFASLKNHIELESKKEEIAQGDEPIAGGLTAGKAVHRLPEPAYHYQQVDTVENTAQSSWIDSLGNWGSWAAGLLATATVAAASYAAWHLRRRWAHRKLPVPPEATAMLLGGATTIVSVQGTDSASLDTNNYHASQAENVTCLSGPSAYFEECGTEKNNSLSNVTSYWDGQGTLIGVDLITRQITGEKYNKPIGNFSYTLQHEEKLDKTMANLSRAIQSAEKASWLVGNSTDNEEANFFNHDNNWKNSGQNVCYNRSTSLPTLAKRQYSQTQDCLLR